MIRKRTKQTVFYDLLVLAFIPILASFLSLGLNLNFFFSTLFFFFLPSVYLSIRTRNAILRSLLFAIPFSVVSVLLIDHMAVLDLSWYVPTTMFNFRIFNTVPIEDLFWGFSVTYLIIMFYEHFLDKGNHRIVGERMKILYYFLIISLTLFLTILTISKHIPIIDYWYFKFGIIIILLPTITFILSFPRYLKKFIRVSPYFFFVGLSQEIVGLHLNYWDFPGKHFIGWVTIFGYRFPFEELFFWIIIFSTCVLCYFEFFDDNKLQFQKSEEAKIFTYFQRKKKR